MSRTEIYFECLVIMKIFTRDSQVLVLRNSVQSQIVSLLMLFIEGLVILTIPPLVEGTYPFESRQNYRTSKLRYCRCGL